MPTENDRRQLVRDSTVRFLRMYGVTEETMCFSVSDQDEDLESRMAFNRYLFDLR
jgi:hypothetical protein